jgi:anthranilate synthase component II
LIITSSSDYIKSVEVLIIDNQDSFTYNLVQMVKQNGIIPAVKLCDEVTPIELTDYDKILVSPGPGVPSDKLKDLIRHAAGKNSIFGVCLGHQAIAEVFGGRIIPSKRIYHGESVITSAVIKDYFLFNSLPEDLITGRYHSWVVDPGSLPAGLEVTCVDPSGEIMGLRHKEFDIHSVQFHPESILTPEGKTIITNWLMNPAARKGEITDTSGYKNSGSF